MRTLRTPSEWGRSEVDWYDRREAACDLLDDDQHVEAPRLRKRKHLTVQPLMQCVAPSVIRASTSVASVGDDLPELQ